ncbi:MAG: bacillithiol biosynthesis deacetylase BshB1 [Bacteroidia bacterium]|nr:bacillithiol biosynthesis deacetylase BshB1 [Bacteroidia bacterium]
MKIDVLAFGAHPDDVELSCAGTLVKMKKLGKSIGIVDLTKGELGTRGTAETRKSEAEESSKVLNLDVRENLDLGDGWFTIDKSNLLKVIQVIRKYRPSIVFANAIKDRHIDHPKGAELVKQAAFLAGLSKIETYENGVLQENWRPPHLFHYIQYYHIRPDFVIDITNEFETKMKSVLAYKTQFYNPESKEETTLISSKKFLSFIESRAREFGGAIEKEFGEGFTSETPLTYDLLNLL